ncbi:uncharacterized protein EAF02_001035 [Botrytis sinoallii]|uniref:uncharacterized protein n=1 Tax=Botrytis sinoallii TaxID=1463999 RepID=UPI0018FF9C3F|nr:uncharacterized protein EAF02_001035 [Botrytis sinoallii]KAF7893497.1 hypothetical protein EAF02_001035 [Botrytis sinoallii]
MRGTQFTHLIPILFGRLINATPETFPYIQSTEFDAGDYGAYPNRTYTTRPDLISPRLNILQDDPRCDDGLYTMISLRGDKVHITGQSPMIHDHQGNLVWMNASYGETFGLNVQRCKDVDYLTFWQGDDSVGAHGEGVYILLDSQYKEAYRLTAGNNVLGDLHEFHITPEGTALVTQYILKEMGIQYRRRTQTNEIIFEWHASEHFNTEDSYFPTGSAGLRSSHGYDFFHINSVDKDGLGNYLISPRYYQSVSYIDGKTGEILWELGGKRNSFKDLSEGKATVFSWQHDAHRTTDRKGITLFDNGARYGLRPQVESSRAIHVSLDIEAMTAEIVRVYVNPRKILSASQGNMQVLENGNVMVGYGYNAAWTEYSSEGEVLCDFHIGSQKTFNTGAVQTYKVLKHAWIGRPDTVPDVKVVQNNVYVSWNGATEVRAWVMEGAKTGRGEGGEEKFQMVAEVKKSGFETKILFQRKAWCWVRVIAIDGEGVKLETSEIWATGTDCKDTIDLPETEEIIEEEGEAAKPLIPSKFALKVIALAGFAFGMLELCRRKFWKRTLSSFGYRVLPIQAQD